VLLKSHRPNIKKKKKDPPGLFPNTDHVPLQQIVSAAHVPMLPQQVVSGQQSQESPASQEEATPESSPRDIRGSDEVNQLTLKSLEQEEQRLAEQNKIHQLEADGEGKDTLPQAIDHIQSHFDQVISKIDNLKPEDNLDESIAESERLLGLYDKIKTSIHAQIDKYKEYSGENIKDDVNPSFILADPLSPEAHRLAKMNDLHDYLVEDPNQPKPHDQTIEEIIAERDVETKAASLLNKADNSLGDLFTHDLGSPVDDLVGQEQEIATDAESPYGAFEAKIKFVNGNKESSSSPVAEDGVHIIPTTLEPESKQEVKISYVKRLPTKEEDAMKLNNGLSLSPQAVEADVVSQEPSGPPPAEPPAPIVVPEGLLRPIVVPHALLHPTLQYK